MGGERRQRTWDVVIVDATGKPADCSLRLRGELLLRDLRVQLEIVAAPSDRHAPPISGEHLTRAAYAVLLLSVQEDDGREETAYLGVPAARYPGQSARFVLAGTRPPPGSVEIGRVRGDVASLAARIAGKVRKEGR
jgi:hypothetical protein